MKLPGFAGGSNVLSSSLVDCEHSINLRPESTAPGTAKSDVWLPRTPGLAYLFETGGSRVSQGFSIDGRAFIVSETLFLEQFADDTVTVRGNVTTQSGEFPVATMCSNGTAGDQVFITSGGNGYIFTLSTNTLAIIADSDFPAGEAYMCEFLAGYFLVQVRDSRSVQWSALEDGTSWDPLDVMERSWAPDNISFIKRSGTHVWIVGNQTSEVWYLTGGLEIFAPAQESLIEHGCVAPFSGVRVAETVAWLDQDERGAGVVVIAKGLTPEQISTTANARYEQARHDNMPYAIGFAYQMDGHLYYVLQGNDNDYPLTPVYDMTEGRWFDIAHWDPIAVRWRTWRGQCHWYFDNRHFIGDRLSGAVYQLSQENLTDELVDV